MLDKSKPYGQVHGHAPYAFMQNGKYFNAQGEEVTEKGELVQPKQDPTELSDQGFTDALREPAKDARTELTEAFMKETVDTIKGMLEDRDVTFDKKAVKADLVSMLVDDELAD